MTTLIGWMNHLVGQMLFQGGYVATPRALAAMRDDAPRNAGAPTPGQSAATR